MSDIIIEIDGLSLSYGDNLLTDQASLKLQRGKTTGLVGESGSGKTLTALSILRLLPAKIVVKSGNILFNSQGSSPVSMDKHSTKEINRIRGGKISMIFQEPMTSLNPSMTCGRQIMEAILRHKDMNRKEATKRTIELLKDVKLPDPERVLRSWPHQLSGGQRQRVMIAMALSTMPELLIADEPTTALDVTVQKSILDLLNELRVKYNLSILFITHDLMVLKQIADDIAVMYQGKIVESGSADQILNHPREIYTKALIACKPKLNSSPWRLPTISEFIYEKDQIGDQHKNQQGDQQGDQQDVKTEIKPSISNKTLLLSVKNLNKWFTIKGRSDALKAVNNVSFDVYEGETMGLVGESGSGKSTLGRTILKLIEANSGEIIYRGMDLSLLSQRKIRSLRKNIQVVFQDPYSSLNPRLTIGRILREPMEIHHIGNNMKERVILCSELLEQVGLSTDSLSKYPHQFSGGQRQRIGIARALACQPEFMILDESVSALDVSIQAQILNLLNDLKQMYKLTYIFISHDLTVVKYMSDRVLIMKDGKIIETGSSDKIYMQPEEEYTRNLINAIPQ